jgi:hypothetical protein
VWHALRLAVEAGIWFALIGALLAIILYRVAVRQG